jgi:hypothetical protein
MVFAVITLMTIKNSTFGLKLAIFLMPYNYFSLKGFFGVNNAVVYGILFGNLLIYAIRKNKLVVINKIIRKFFYAFFVSLMISVIVIFYGKVNYSEMYFYTMDVLDTTPFFIANLLTGPILFLLIVKDYQIKKDIMLYVKPFLLSFIYFFLSWCGFYLNISLPKFISYKMQGTGYTTRFTGFWGDYELTAEIVFIYIILSILFNISHFAKNKLNLFTWFIILSSIFIGITTGTRSLIVLYILYFIVIIYYYVTFRGLNLIRRVFIVIVLSVLIFMAILFMMSDALFSSRINDTLNILKSLQNINLTGLQVALNRNYTDSYLDILEVGRFFGIGPVLVSTFRGSYMVYHNLYYHITLCFGLIGLIIYLFFIGYIEIKAFIASKRLKNIKIYMLFALIFVLHIDQIKIDYWRDSPTIQIYWYLFALTYSIVFINNKTKTEFEVKK